MPPPIYIDTNKFTLRTHNSSQQNCNSRQKVSLHPLIHRNPITTDHHISVSPQPPTNPSHPNPPSVAPTLFPPPLYFSQSSRSTPRLGCQIVGHCSQNGAIVTPGHRTSVNISRSSWLLGVGSIEQKWWTKKNEILLKLVGDDSTSHPRLILRCFPTSRFPPLSQHPET